jgi:large subunit ribosomal protein L35
MPKIKTHKSTAKRFKRTGTGKLMRQNMPKGHLRRRHAKRNNRKLDRYAPVELREQEKKINQLAPYIK